MKKTTVFLALLCATMTLFAQKESPLDDITYRNIVNDKAVLQHQMPDERDVFWQKRTWRVIDVREKMNQPFMYPQAPFFDILTKAAMSGEIAAYDAAKEDFSQPLSPQELDGLLSRTDTIELWESDFESNLQVVRTAIFYEDIRRYRIKEMWYFDSKTSSLQVRILGIAPLQDVMDVNGNFKYEKPLFWIYYPEAREVLAREMVFSEGNEAARTTWEDLFEMRHFASYIYKESNVRDNRLQDMYVGVDLLLQADKIRQEIFDFEHDLWEY